MDLSRIPPDPYSYSAPLSPVILVRGTTPLWSRASFYFVDSYRLTLLIETTAIAPRRTPQGRNGVTRYGVSVVLSSFHPLLMSQSSCFLLNDCILPPPRSYFHHLTVRTLSVNSRLYACTEEILLGSRGVRNSGREETSTTARATVGGALAAVIQTRSDRACLAYGTGTLNFEGRAFN